MKYMRLLIGIIFVVELGSTTLPEDEIDMIR